MICKDGFAKHKRNTRKNVSKKAPELSVPLRGRSDHDPNIAQTVSKPSAGQASPSIFRGTFCLAKQHFVHPLTFENTFRARLPSKKVSGRCENEALVRDFLQKVKVEDAKTKLWCELPSKSGSERCENEAFVRDFLEKVKVEDVKTKLSCETSLSESGRCETKLRDVPQKVKVEDVKAKLWCETSLKKSKWKM